MEQITIRTATRDDLPMLLRFEQGVIAAERPLDSTLKKGDLRYYDIEKMMASPEVELAVAEVGNEIIGCGYARIEAARHYLRHQKHAYLGFMYVTPGHRGKNVNKKVIAFLKKWAIVQGMTEMRLEVYYDNLPAIKAYEKAGFSRHMITMRMGLDNLQ